MKMRYSPRTVLKRDQTMSRRDFQTLDKSIPFLLFLTFLLLPFYFIPMKQNYLLGAIAGDVVGSAYEWNNVKTKDFPLFGPKTEFTDDSVLTAATMDVLLNGLDYASAYQSYSRRYPNRGYGGRFSSWIQESDPKPYNSWGNGSAMRVSPVGWAFDTLEEVLQEAERSASVTHNHPEGIKGAQATAGAIFLARTGKTKAEIKQWVVQAFNYPLDLTIDQIRPAFQFDESCQGTVPQAITAFLESTDFEDAIRLAISLGGDSDTIACITGAIAEAFYGVPEWLETKVLEYLPLEMKQLIALFYQRINIEKN